MPVTTRGRGRPRKNDRQPEEKPDVSDENGHGVGDGDDEPLEPYRKPVMMTISDLSKGRGRGRPKKDGFSKPINAKTSSKSTSTKASAAKQGSSSSGALAAVNKEDEPYRKPVIMTINDLKGKSSGTTRSGRAKPKDYTYEYEEESDDDFSDEEAVPTSRKVGKCSKPTAKESKKSPAKKPKVLGKKKKNADTETNGNTVGTVVTDWESTNGHVLQAPAESAEVPSLPITNDERRKMMAEAAEKRLQMREGRGLQDAEGYRMKVQKKEELEKHQEALRICMAKPSATHMAWQV